MQVKDHPTPADGSFTPGIEKESRRRGACPGLSAPMPTGDGLLVRFLPIGTVPLGSFTALCEAARQHGSGVVEITARGSVQVRGLNAASARCFADTIAARGIAAGDGIPVHCGALAGLDAAEMLDASALAADLRRALAGASLSARLGAKVSVALDGGGQVSLDRLSTDIRLRAALINGAVAWRVAVGGDAVSAAEIGVVAPADAIEAVVRLLEVVAQHGRDVRARDILRAQGIAPFRSALGTATRAREHRAQSRASPVSGRTSTSEAIGTYPLRDGSFAAAVGVAFGYADASVLEQLARAAAAAGANGMRTAPGRALVAVGLRHETVMQFTHAAEQLGFIAQADDPRRRVIACAGAPICESGHIAARALAPVIAQAAAPYLDGAATIHVSGCTKGCAHSAPATLTIVGMPGGCALVRGGSSRDAAFAVVPAGERELAAAVAEHLAAARRAREAAHG